MEAPLFLFPSSKPFTVLFLFVSVLSVLAASSASSSAWASASRTLTATSYITFHNGTAAATVVQVVCGTFVTETVNITTTLLLPNEIVTVYVVQATETRTVEYTRLTATSTLRLSTCSVLHQRVVANATTTGAMYVYVQSPRSNYQEFLVGLLVAASYVAMVMLCAVAFFRQRRT